MSTLYPKNYQQIILTLSTGNKSQDVRIVAHCNRIADVVDGKASKTAIRKIKYVKYNTETFEEYQARYIIKALVQVYKNYLKDPKQAFDANAVLCSCCSKHAKYLPTINVYYCRADNSRSAIGHEITYKPISAFGTQEHQQLWEQLLNQYKELNSLNYTNQAIDRWLSNVLHIKIVDNITYQIDLDYLIRASRLLDSLIQDEGIK